MKYYILLLRPKDWAKNLFMFLPVFFSGNFLDPHKIRPLLTGLIVFCLFASSIYIINDFCDLEKDSHHPEKRKRPLVSGKVSKPAAVIICILMVVVGTIIGYTADSSLQFLFLLGIYFFINLAYCFGLKNIAVLEMLILASGFVLRVKAGAAITVINASNWLIIVTFLLALFLAIAKRRDDVLLTLSNGKEMRKSITGYNLDFLNTMMGIVCAIIIVSYIMYSIDPSTLLRLGTHRLYYSCLFVIAGIMRYLQITLVEQRSSSPTEILFKDRFIQITILLWIVFFIFILYIKNIHFFNP
jgi:decaprenyl-phosphate phosphoribosyltransferase